MDKIRKAFWFSFLLTGAGQFYLGEKKKGLLLFLFSLLGILASCLGVTIIMCAFLELINKVFVPLGIIFFIGSILMIVISGCKSIRDITSRNKKQG